MASDIYNTGQSNVTGAYDAGKSAINSFDPSAWQQQTSNGYNSMFANQQQGQNDFVQSFKNQILNGQPSATDYYKQGNDMYGVAPLKQQATQLNNAMLQTPQMNYDRTKGFNVSNDQVQQQTNQDLMRLSPLAAAANNQAQTAEQLASGYAQAGQAQNQLNIVPYQQQGQMLNDLQARQATGFGQQQEQELNGLISKMQSGVQLSSQEMQSLQALSSSEMSYQSALNTANASVQSAKIAAQNQIVGQGGTYFNPTTKQYYTPNVGAGVLK